jgi:TonB family protein
MAKHHHKWFYVFLLILVSPGWSQDLGPVRVVGLNYPPLAVREAIKGTLKIECNVSSEGKVLSAQIIRGPIAGPVHDILGKAAQENALQWIFRADRSPRSIVLTYSFELVVKHNPANGSKFVFDSPDSIKVIAEVSDRSDP